jgi:hypothetical protein
LLHYRKDKSPISNPATPVHTISIRRESSPSLLLVVALVTQPRYGSQGKHWKHPNFIYGRPEDGGIGVHHLPTRIKTLRFNFLQKFIAVSNRENAWYLQAHNIKMYAPGLHAEAVLKLKLNPAHFPKPTPYTTPYTNT